MSNNNSKADDDSNGNWRHYPRALQALLEGLAIAESKQGFLDFVVRLIHEHSGCKFVGIRVLTEDGYIPYQSYVGFDRDFWEKENMIHVSKEDCSSTRIVSGKLLPFDMPIINSCGSLCCNDTLAFAQTLTEEQQKMYRGVCDAAGFRSVAVIPVCDNDTILGVIHLADYHPNQLSPGMLSFVETIAPLVGKVLATDRLERLNAELENRVAERTAELQEINAALEEEITEKLASYDKIREQAELLDYAHDYIMVRDLNSRIIYWNRGAENGYGFTAREALGEITHNLLQTEFPDSVEQTLASIFTDGHWEGELVHTRKDGVRITVQSNQTLNRDDDGRPISILEINHDITERKQADQRIREQAELLDLAYDYILVRDLNGKISYWNKGAEKGYGFTAAEAVGQTKKKLLHTEFPESEDSLMATLLADGHWTGELIQTRKDCGRLTVQSHWTLNRDSSGKPVSILEINHDITTEKQAQKLLQEANLRLERFNTELETTVAVRTAELQEINATLEEEIMERQAAQEALHKLNAELELRVAERTAELQEINATLEEEIMERQAAQEALRKLNAELEGRVAERTAELQEINATLEEEIMERQVAQEALVDSNKELSERERLLQRTADELAETNKELTSFANSIAHDFRSPMVNLKGFSHELGGSLAEVNQAIKEAGAVLLDAERQRIAELLEKEVPEALGFIYSSVDRLDKMVNALLGLARLGRRELVLEEVDMMDVALKTVQAHKHEIDGKKISVTMGKLPTVSTNRLAMEQIIGNLVDNAVKYLRQDVPGMLAITAAETPDEVIFSVSDNGRGIAKEDFERIFQVFRRAGAQDVPGEGMGLAYVRTLVRQLGGRAWCESELGIGTTMTFSVPKSVD